MKYLLIAALFSVSSLAMADAIRNIENEQRRIQAEQVRIQAEQQTINARINSQRGYSQPRFETKEEWLNNSDPQSFDRNPERF